METFWITFLSILPARKHQFAINDILMYICASSQVLLL